MRWPSFADYEFAVKNAFAYSVFDPNLKGGKPGKGMSGGFSRVYPVNMGSKTFALRCWIRDVGDAKRRYEKISAYLKQVGLPYFVDFEYLPEGIWVRGTKYPITRMEWANGLPLRAFIEQNLQNADVLRTVATEFQKMVAALHAHEISHGDLQDGNILLEDNGNQVDIKLIDYDSVFVPTLRGSPDSGIVGLPEYQHPQRIAGVGQTGEKVDYFSELVIYLSFLSLAEKPELWSQFKDSTGDGLLFSADDFKNPDTSGVFGELEKLSAEVRELAATLKHFCAETSIAQLAPLEIVLPTPPHEKCYEQGTAYRHNGRYAEAVDKFREAVTLNPDFKEAYHGLGLTYLMTGKLDEAKEAAEKALAIDSSYQPARELMDALQTCLATVEFRKLRSQNKELQTQIAALRTQNRELQTEKTSLGRQLDDARQRWQTEAAALHSKTQGLQAQIDGLRSENRELQTEKTDLGKQLDDAQQLWRAETAELPELRSENEKLQVQTGALHQQNEKLQTEADELRNANRALQTETAKLQSQNSELQEEKTASQQQLDRAFRRWKTVIGGLSAICVACFIAIFFQLHSKNEADSQIGSLQDEQQQSKAQLQKLQNQLAEKDTEIRGLKSASQKSAREEERLRSQNRTLQNQNAALLKELGKAQQNRSGGRTRIQNYTNMVLIPEGRFQMGSKNGAFDEKPVHTVHVDAFYIDKYEVTNAQYKKFVDVNPQWRKNSIPRAYHNGSYLSDWNQNEYPIGKGEHPVTYVSWYAAMAYAQWAGKRLPTEAEWEKAARGKGVGQRYPWGNSIDSDKANYGTHRTTRVGTYPANHGLYDMAGNVTEWCLDAYQGGFYKSSHRRNPLAGGTLTEVVTHFTNQKGSRVLRGGSWGSDAQTVRVADRRRSTPTYASAYAGFRCVKEATR